MAATPGTVDQAHRHFQRLLQFARKKVGHTAELARRGGTAHLPGGGQDVVLRRQRGVVRQLDVTYAGVGVGAGNGLCGALGVFEQPLRAGSVSRVGQMSR